MQIVTEMPLAPPGVCFICEQSNDMAYVNTGYSFDPPIPTHLNGIKFVCAACIAQMAKLLGLVDSVEVEMVKAELVNAYSKIAQHKSMEDLIFAMQAFISAYPAPKARSAAKAAASTA